MCVQNHLTAAFADLIKSHALRLVPSEPTHHVFRVDREPSYTWLDLFIVKTADAVTNLKKTDALFIAGHDFIELLYRCAKPPVHEKSVKSRCLKRHNAEALTGELRAEFSVPATGPAVHSATPGRSLQELHGSDSRDVDLVQSRLARALITAYDKVAPMRPIRLSSKRKPWVSPSIRAPMKKGVDAYKIASHSSLRSDAEKYKSLRARVCNALDTSKNEYILNSLARAEDEASLSRELHNLRVHYI